MKKSIFTEFHLYIDGASRGNPGESGAGCYLFNFENKKTIFKKSFYLNIKTNNQAEYLALILALECCKDFCQKTDSLLIFSDSLLLVQQLNKVYKIKNLILINLFKKSCELLQNFSYKIQHIAREKNYIADALANLAIDEKINFKSKYLENNEI